MIERIDIVADTPGDYTLKVKGLPITERREEIKKFFENKVHELTGDAAENSVPKVSLAYNLNEYVHE